VPPTVSVMIVDDSAETRDVLKMLISYTEAVVIAEAENGQDALDQLHALTPDMILLDINMPVMDGLAAAAQISSRYPEIKIIMLSVQNDLDYVRRSLAAGASDYLYKPVPLEQLRLRIQSVQQQLPS
jgi:YesN/AraC family two-component response regulator